MQGRFNGSKSKAENMDSYNEFIVNNDSIGRFETDDEANTRLWNELKGTKESLENMFKISVDYLVFPGGGNTKKVLDMAKQSGYKLVSQGKDLNRFNSNAYQITRYSGYYNFPKPLNLLFNLVLLLLQISRGNGNRIISLIFKVVKNVKIL